MMAFACVLGIAFCAEGAANHWGQPDEWLYWAGAGIWSLWLLFDLRDAWRRT